MTAETLKPFITPTSVASHYPATHSPKRHQRTANAVSLGLSITAVILATVLMGVTAWHLIRLSNLETEVKALRGIVESMRVRLGLNYLEDLEDFKKEYSNVLIDMPSNSTASDSDIIDSDDDVDDGDEDINDDVDDDEEEDDDDVFYTGDYTDLIDSEDDLDAMVKKYNSYDADIDDDVDDDDSSDTIDMNLSDDDNLYDDYGKYKDSKKKQSARKTRAITNAYNGLPVHEDSLLNVLNKPDSLNTENNQEQQSRQNDLRQEYNRKRPTMRYDWSDWDNRLPYQENLHKIRNSRISTHRITSFVHNDATKERRSNTPLRQHGQRRHKIPITKSEYSISKKMSGDFLLSAKAIDRSQPIVLFLPAAHFHLHNKQPSRHAPIKVDSYPGDIYLGTPSASHAFAMERYFKVENGVLTVREPGLYYIYAQVCYNNTHDQNGFVIFHGHKPFLQCLNTVPTNLPLKIHTCHTSGLIHLRANETIHLRDLHSDHNVVLKESNNRSYFGLIKI